MSASQEMEAVKICAQTFQGRTNAAVPRDTNWQIMDLLAKVRLVFIDTLLVEQSFVIPIIYLYDRIVSHIDDTMDPCLIANCEHSCEVVSGDVDTARCLCPKGYYLSSDRVSCDEVNECLTRNGGCQDLCTNVPGSYECNCSKGYKLADNGLTCEGVFSFPT